MLEEFKSSYIIPATLLGTSSLARSQNFQYEPQTSSKMSTSLYQSKNVKNIYLNFFN